MAFANRPRLLLPFSDNPVAIRAAVREAQQTRPRRTGGTARILTAITAAASLFKAGGSDPRRRKVVVAITHNEEQTDARRQDEVVERLAATNVSLTAVVSTRCAWKRGLTLWSVWNLPGEPVPPVRKTIPHDCVERPNRHTIDSIVLATGGELFLDGAPFAEVLPEVLTRLRLHYVIGFYPEEGSASPGRFRRLRIELTPSARQRHPRALVRHREGYRAPSLP